MRTTEGTRCDYATTLGAGGLFIASDAPPPPRTRLKLRFRLPGSEDLHKLTGQVRWLQAADPARVMRLRRS